MNINNKTCLTFDKWFEFPWTKNRRIFFDSQSADELCSSYVGMRPDTMTNGAQPLIITKDCDKSFGSISHEILHCLGIYHTHQRFDRDEYVSIVADEDDENNIKLSATNSSNFGLSYDYGSILHYSAAHYRAKEPFYTTTLGNRYIDNRCLNNGYWNPIGCKNCICPHGFAGRFCGDRDPGTTKTGETIKEPLPVLETGKINKCEKFEVNIGMDNEIQNIYFSNTWYHFQATKGKKVQFFIYECSANDPSNINENCNFNGAELKLKEFTRTGYRFCNNSDEFIANEKIFLNLKRFTSSDELAMIQLFSRYNKLSLKLNYRFVNEEKERLHSSCFPPGYDLTYFYEYARELGLEEAAPIAANDLGKKEPIAFNDHNAEIADKYKNVSCNIYEDFAKSCPLRAHRGECINDRIRMSFICSYSCALSRKLCNVRLSSDING